MKQYSLDVEFISSLKFKSLFEDLLPFDNFGREKILNKLHNTESNNSSKETLEFLIDLCSLHLNLNDNPPYHPRWELANGATSFSLNHINDNNLEILEKIYKEIHDNFLRSRIADILWIKKRNYTAAIVAINAYLELSRQIDFEENGTDLLECAGRALKLSTKLGLSNEHFQKCILHIKYLFEKFQNYNPSYTHLGLLNLIVKHETPEYLIKILKPLAEKSLESDSLISIDLHNQLSELYKKNKDLDSFKDTLKKISELYESIAEHYSQVNDPAVAAVHITQAIEALRKSGSFKDKIKELNKKLTCYQKESLKQIRAFSTNQIDITKMVEESRNIVKNKTPIEALYNFAKCMPYISKKEVEKTLDIACAPIIATMYKKVVGNKGQTIRNIKGSEGNNYKSNTEAYEHEVLIKTLFFQDLLTQAHLIPAIIQINQEHRITPQILYHFLCNNPLVDENKMNLYIHGLTYFFELRMIEALHILVPLLESSLRSLLESKGEPTTKLTSTHTQPEMLLNDLLEHEVTYKTLGDDFIYELKTTFNELCSSNLRNRLAHGLLNDNDFDNCITIYACWLIFKLLMMPIRIKESDNTE